MTLGLKVRSDELQRNAGNGKSLQTPEIRLQLDAAKSALRRQARTHLVHAGRLSEARLEQLDEG